MKQAQAVERLAAELQAAGGMSEDEAIIAATAWCFEAVHSPDVPIVHQSGKLQVTINREVGP